MNIYDTRLKVNRQAYTELRNAIDKWGLQENISLAEQFLILSEEYGEISMALLDKDYANAKVEICQTIAMLYRLYFLIEKEIK
jgi:hypothetical protein